MDKTSVLGNAIKYVKKHQEKVKTLEEEAAKHTMESVMFVQRSQVMAEDEESSDENNGNSDEQRLPEIEARVYNKNILLKIQCEKRKGLLVKVLVELGKLNLDVVNASVAPFGNLILDITIVAEMEKEFSLPVKDVVTALRSALQAAP
ncbi:hypothetical protein Pfo_019299 [Paulownia fortunei]|nr:hypothetical protein Pfo_019299 [Paulownia fortunei]